MKIVYIFAIVLLAVIACSQLAMAQIPRTISYQGVLTDNLGVPKLDGSYSLTFRLYDALTSGTLLWTEAKTLDVKRGLFSTILGDQVVIPDAVIFDKPYWLSIQVAAEPELSPRIPLTAVGYSFSSMRAETSMVSMLSMKAETSMVSLVSVGDTLWKKSADKIYHMGGYVGIGTVTPGAGLAVSGTGLWSSAIGIQNTTADMEWRIATDGDSSLNFVKVTGPTFTPLTIAVDGNVGIGTTAPQRKLDVNGPVHLNDSVVIGSPTQNGGLTIHQNGLANPTLDFGYYNSYGGRLYLYNSDGGYSTLIRGPENSNGGGTFGVTRDLGTYYGFKVTGNYNNTNNPLVQLFGTNRSTSFNMSVAGNGSVNLPDSSISSDEMFDEPGIASDYLQTIAIPTTGVTNVTSATINVPGAGYIVARARADAYINGATIGNIRIGIATNATTIPTIYTGFGSNNEVVPSAIYRWGAMYTEQIFTVTTSGINTYYLNADRTFDGGTGALWRSQLTLTYYPTSYGTVGTAVPLTEAQQFQSVTPIDMPSDGAQGAVSTEKLYKVDLRELELKAAKARATAEKAERELMEAKMNEQNGSINPDNR